MAIDQQLLLKYASTIQRIIKTSDINTISARDIRKSIEREFSVSLEKDKQEFDAFTKDLFVEYLSQQDQPDVPKSPTDDSAKPPNESPKKGSPNKSPEREVPFEPNANSDGEYEVEAILSHRNNNGKEYLIKWLGWGPEHNEWIPESEIFSPDLLREYNKKVEAKKAARKKRKTK